jgi:protein-tyrosine phosphatase
MLTELYWIEGPWPGRLAISARPRGGDWLIDEISRWRKNGVDTVVSLLTSAEVKEMELQNEGLYCRQNKIEFVSFSIEDRMTPTSDADAIRLIEELDSHLARNKNVVIHCRQGIGRSGLVAVSLLIERGVSVPNALERVSGARRAQVPETSEQLAWIENHAAILSAAGHPAVTPERKP